ncbi:SDR family oxidoreductase TDEL_0C00230 [Torulaspora delbrueckii]|uniref:NAD-dependent epimerase/dehydratase domain-containing protein n=1 Tax=Torulaspora delbrueckii TaxID=4950 RepID=G8ZQX0_TORDE|nr:hypothetical protein TDEL_0C00230 [Torulaspora delbrueckii]CCE90912.1 hypothetical protein TDEL_0C00230 [Torulaspora delbrueckii]
MSILVSGATGFIALHVVSDLLKQDYKVIGTVRSQEKADKLHKQFGNNPNLSFELVSDIAAPEAFDKVFQKHGKDIKVVLHTASPFTLETTNYEKDLLLPAVNGTKSILESIKKYAADSVERVVVTSSHAAVMDVSKEGDGSIVYTEKDWNPATWENCQIDGLNAYCGSKKLAEKAAWDFLEENKNVVKFKMSTINPTYVFGPQLFDEDVKDKLNTSCELINSILKNNPQVEYLLENFKGHFVDVRDVAKAHLVAFQKDEAIGQRLLTTNGRFVYQDLVDIINEDFPQLKGKVIVGKPGAGKQLYGTFPDVNNTRSKEILGFEFISLHKSVHDTAAQVLKKEGKL